MVQRSLHDQHAREARNPGTTLVHEHRWLRVRALGARPGGSEGIQTCQPFLRRSGLN